MCAVVTVWLYKSPTDIFEPGSNRQGTSSLCDGISSVRFLWSLAADTNNSRITLATETNRGTPEASFGLYKNTSKEEMNRQILVLQNCRRYQYIQYHTAGCFAYQQFYLCVVCPYIVILAGRSLSLINH
jgi:hypothetical protein